MKKGFPIHITSLGTPIELFSRHFESTPHSVEGDEHISPFGGGGFEFKGYREYTFQDSAKDIDWKASLRADNLLVREYYQQKGLNVMIVYDVSDSMLFGSQAKIKAHYGAEFILALAGSILTANHNVGLICFAEKIKYVVSPASGEKQIGIFFDILRDYSTYGGNFDMVEVLDYLNASSEPGTIIIFVSDFLGNKNFLERVDNKLKYLSRRFDVISVILRDPRDEFMPNEDLYVVVSDPSGKREVFFNAKSIKKEYEKYAKEQKIWLKKFLRGIGAELLELYTDKNFIKPTIEFFVRRGSEFK